MAENYNLIPASELPTTEANEVDVLCVENGELKRKSASNLGGGGYVIHVPADELTIDENSGDVTITLTESRDNFGPVLETGGNVWLDLSATNYGEMVSGIARLLVVMWVFSDDLLMMGANMGSEYLSVFCPNGTWTPETEG